MAAHTSPTFRRRRLARRIRRLREQAGLTQGEAATGLDMSTSALSRKETGEVGTSVHEVRSMMDLYDIYDPELVDLARAAKAKPWWHAYGIKDRGYPELETEARTVREFALAYLPGLLQTEDYMRTLFASGNRNYSKQEIANAVGLRRARRELITTADEPLDFSVVIDETALTRPIGGSEVMRTQLDALMDDAEMSNVELRVLPTSVGNHGGLESAFTLLSYADADEPEILYIEHVGGSFSTSAKREVDRANITFADMWNAALNVYESVKRIKEVAHDM